MSLARDSQHGQATEPRGQRGFDQAGKAGAVKVAAVRERRRHDVEDPRPFDHQTDLAESRVEKPGVRHALGTSPSSRMRLRLTEGSGIGTAERSASVYGCFGLL